MKRLILTFLAVAAVAAVAAPAAALAMATTVSLRPTTVADGLEAPICPSSCGAMSWSIPPSIA